MSTPPAARPDARATPRIPDFFILGAARCGTTSLAQHLGRHPAIFMSDPKEPTFFSEPFQGVSNPIRYVKLFERAGPDALVGEASHAYLSHPDAAATVRAFFPNARFVLVLRDPADRALALYHWATWNALESERSFEAALAAEERRFGSERFARRCRQYFWNFMYVRSGLFGEQLARYRRHYPAERFFVTTLDEIVAETDGVTERMLKFLGADPVPLGPLPRANASRAVRSVPLQHLNRRLLRRLAKHGLPGGRALHDRLLGWNAAPPAEMEPATRERLDARFAPDLARLRELCDVDFAAR